MDASLYKILYFVCFFSFSHLSLAPLPGRTEGYLIFPFHPFLFIFSRQPSVVAGGALKKNSAPGETREGVGPKFRVSRFLQLLLPSHCTTQACEIRHPPSPFLNNMTFDFAAVF